MNKIINFDEIIRIASKLSKKGAKAKKIIKAVTFAWTLFNVIAVIWSLIPKQEKLSDVSGEALIEAVGAQGEEEQEMNEPLPENVIPVPAV